MRRCGYCGNRGHNRRSCPTMKERAANGNTWAQDQLARNKNIASRPKTCTYCREGGHNRASCQKLIADYVSAITENAKYRKTMLDNMKASGLGVGALITPKYSADNRPEIITDIRWDRVCYMREHAEFVFVDGEDYASYPINIKQFNVNVPSSAPKYESNYFILEEPTDCSEIENCLPVGWTSGKCSDIDDRFGMNEKKRRRL